MKHPRILHFLVPLADGTVIAMGGSTLPRILAPINAVPTPELYDPVANTWTDMAPIDQIIGQREYYRNFTKILHNIIWRVCWDLIFSRFFSTSDFFEKFFDAGASGL